MAGEQAAAPDRIPWPGRTRWWALLALIPVGTFVTCAILSEPFRSQFDLVREIDAGAFPVDNRDLVQGLAFDAVFIASWFATIPALARIAEGWLAPFQLEKLRYENAFWLALAAGALDVLEGALLAVAGAWRPQPLLVVLATVGWLKVVAYLAAVVVVGGMLVIGLGAPASFVLERIGRATVDRWNRPPPVPTPPATAATPDSDPGPEGVCPASGGNAQNKTGICLSGGGIRAAAIALGALDGLDRSCGGQPSVFRSAAWIYAVSGGGYTAAGWRLSRTPSLDDSSHPGPGNDEDGLFRDGTAWRTHVTRRHRYLENGTLSLLGGIFGAVVRSALVLGSIAAAAVISGWLVGLFVRSPWILPRLPEWLQQAEERAEQPSRAGDPSLLGLVVEDRLVWPGLAVVIGGAVLLVVSATHRRARAARTASLVVLGGGALLLVLLQGLPLFLAFDREVLAWTVGLLTTKKETGQDTGMLGTWLSVASALGIVASLTGLARTQLKKHWLRLGGVLVALLWLLLAAATAHPTVRPVQVERPSPTLVTTGVPGGSWLAVPGLVWGAVAVLVVVSAIATHRLSLAGIYRKRLAQTFVTRRTCCRTSPLAYHDECGMSGYAAAAGPHLVVAATAHSSEPTVSGLKGAGITFDAHHIHLYDGADGGAGSCITTESFPEGSWWRGYPRAWSYSRAMALSGAAVASAMGRQGLGTTNALLVATNLRLGMWIPNPARAGSDFGKRSKDVWPRVGLSYLVKELFGRYHLGNDPFIYVADGGHRDNLGLVELLRRRPGRVVVIDASGDKPGSFTTLKQAMDLAARELKTTITLPLERLGSGDSPGPGAEKPAADTLPASCVAAGEVGYPDGTVGRIFYARHQVSAAAPPALLDFAARNPRFPNYSTGDQFLRDDEFTQLVALGKHMGDELMALIAEPSVAVEDSSLFSPSPGGSAGRSTTSPSPVRQRPAAVGGWFAAGLLGALTGRWICLGRWSRRPHCRR